MLSPADKDLLFWCEKLRFCRKVDDHPVRNDTDEHRQDTLQDEDPSPSATATHTARKPDGVDESAREGSRDGCRAQKDRRSSLELVSGIPNAKIEDHT